VTWKNVTPCESTVPVPRVVVPSRKVTVPLGFLLPEVGLTVAVRVRPWVVVIWVAEVLSEVVVAWRDCVTVTTTGFETELRSVLLPA
jgi:hypothetical protein